MAETFITTFLSMSQAMGHLLIVSIIAGFLVRKGLIKEIILNQLAKATIRFFIPCLIFSKIILNFNVSDFTNWWLFPLYSFALTIIGLIVGWLFFRKKLPQGRYLLALCSLQNGTYLILIIGSVAFKEQFDRFSIYCFLFTLGLTIGIWTLGKWLVIPRNLTVKNSFLKLLNPPLVANVLGIVFVLIGFRPYIPETVINSIDLIGQAGIPLATFILGSTIGAVNISFKSITSDVLKVLTAKLFIVPVITLIVLLLLNVGVTDPLLADFLILEASVAQASTLIIQVRRYGGHLEEIGLIMMISYIVSLVSVPLWLSIARVLYS